MGADDILEVQDLEVCYTTRFGTLRAIHDLNLTLRRSETYGVVGESGCGKSTLAFAIMGYLERNASITRGRILFNGEDLLKKSRAEMRGLWGKKISMIYQDPTAALNPSLKIGMQIAEILQVHEGASRSAAQAQAVAMLARLQIADPEMIADRYPHQLSGGMRQRVCIAMAFIMKPDLLILDEPTTNLDVTTEANILDMLNDLKSDFSASTLYITHDLGVVYKISDSVGVMYGGRFVEEGYIADIICSPKHPYTRGLLRCIPEVLLDKSKKRLTPITGAVAELDAMPQGCAFSPRCAFREARCAQDDPANQHYGRERRVRCHNVSEIDALRGLAPSCVDEPGQPECEDLRADSAGPRAAHPRSRAQAIRGSHFHVFPRQRGEGARGGRCLAPDTAPVDPRAGGGERLRKKHAPAGHRGAGGGYRRRVSSSMARTSRCRSNRENGRWPSASRWSSRIRSRR